MTEWVPEKYMYFFIDVLARRHLHHLAQTFISVHFGVISSTIVLNVTSIDPQTTSSRLFYLTSAI